MRRPLRMPGVGGAGRKRPPAPSRLMLRSQVSPARASVRLLIVSMCRPAVSSQAVGCCFQLPHHPSKV